MRPSAAPAPVSAPVRYESSLAAARSRALRGKARSMRASLDHAACTLGALASTASPRSRSLPSKLRYGMRLAWWQGRNPIENVLAARERRAAARRGWRPESAYPLDVDWEERLHAYLGVAWPCPDREPFDQAWRTAIGELGQLGLAVGRETFGGWDDGDRALARAAWCVVRHSGPERVVETGVGRGLTTRTILAALETKGAGHLWSIDQPPPLSPALSGQTGAAGAAHVRSRWSYVRVSRRRQLPR